MGRPTKPIELTDEERSKLQQWARRPKSSQRLALRARIVWGCAGGLENRQVARQLHIADQTVCKWRERFRTARWEGLVDEPRPGTPRKITDVHVEELITRTLETTPPQSTHWSTRTMAQATKLSQSAVSRIWRAFGLQPHRTETFKLSSDPLFIEKVRDIVGLYLNPPERALVLCVDEKSQIQALDRTRPILPMRPGVPAPSNSRLHSQRHNLFVCGSRCSHGQSDRRLTSKTEASGVFAFPGTDRRSGSGKLGYPPGDGQLRHPQDAESEAVVCAASSLSFAFHTHQRQLAESSRAFLWLAYGAPDSAWDIRKCSRIGISHPRLFGEPQPRSQTIQLDGGRGHHSQQNRAVLYANL